MIFVVRMQILSSSCSRKSKISIICLFNGNNKVIQNAHLRLTPRNTQDNLNICNKSILFFKARVPLIFMKFIPLICLSPHTVNTHNILAVEGSQSYEGLTVPQVVTQFKDVYEGDAMLEDKLLLNVD